MGGCSAEWKSGGVERRQINRGYLKLVFVFFVHEVQYFGFYLYFLVACGVYHLAEEKLGAIHWLFFFLHGLFSCIIAQADGWLVWCCLYLILYL